MQLVNVDSIFCPLLLFVKTSHPSELQLKYRVLILCWSDATLHRYAQMPFCYICSFHSEWWGNGKVMMRPRVEGESRPFIPSFLSTCWSSPPPDRAMQSTVKRLVLNNHFQDSFKLQKKLETHLDWNLKLCTTKTQKKIQDKLSCRHIVTIKHSNMAEQNVQQKKKIQNNLSCTHCNNQAQSIAEENVSRKMHRGWRARCCKDIYNIRLSQHLSNRPLEYSKRSMWTYLSSEEKGEEDLYCRKNSQP